MNIVVLEGQVNNPGDLSWDALDRFGTVTVYDRTSRDQLKTRVAEADIVVSSKTEWNVEALGWAPRLKMIALTSTGYNVVDLDAARDAGVIVSNVPAYSTPDVAQMTFALLLELCLHVGEHSNLVMEGDWTRAKDFSFWNTPLVELARRWASSAWEASGRQYVESRVLSACPWCSRIDRQNPNWKAMACVK